MKTIKVGLIGAGAIARNHANGIRSHAQGEVVAVADLSEKRAKEIQDEFKLPYRYAEAAELLANPEVDAVSIAVPNKFHAPIASAALKAGKHVILDKPFALSQKEAAQVIAAAKKAKRVFMLGMNHRFETKNQTLRTLIGRGELGEIYHAKVSYLRRGGIPKFGTWFCQKKLSGGGGMLDLGVHGLDLCLYLIDNFKPEAVSGATYTKFGNRGLGEGGWGHSDPGKHVFDVDDFATALIKLRGGATVSLDVSWALHMETGGDFSVRVFGTEAGAVSGPTAKLCRYGKKKGEYEVVEPQGVKPIYAHANRFHNWLDSILGKDKPCVTIEQALAVQKILDAVYASSATGREVRIK